MIRTPHLHRNVVAAVVLLTAACVSAAIPLDGVPPLADTTPAAIRELLTYVELLERKVDDLEHEVRRPAWWPGGPH